MTQVTAHFGSGANTSDEDVYAQTIIRRYIEKKADEKLIGGLAVPSRDVNVMDLKLDRPNSTTIEPELVSEGATADAQRIGFFKDWFSIPKYQSIIRVGDEVTARDMEQITTSVQINAQINGLALKKDKEIFTALAAGAGNSVAATAAWNNLDSVDLLKDIGKAIEVMVENTEILDSDLKNMVVFYPGKLRGYMSTPIQVDNVRTTPMKYIMEEYGGIWQWTRRLSNTAHVVIPGEETAEHYNYIGEAIPRSEVVRVPSVGYDHYYTHMFKTKITPTDEGDTTNDRIFTFTGVYA